MTKKSQMELMGLAIVVVLVTMIMVFVVARMVQTKPTDIREMYKSSELAANTINTLIDTNTGCYDMTFLALYKDCAEGPNIFCGADSSCAYAGAETSKILSSMLDDKSIKYRFKFLVNDDEKVGPLTDPEDSCSKSGVDKRAQYQPLPGMMMVLEICY